MTSRPVHHGDGPPEGSVLVVRSLDPPWPRCCRGGFGVLLAAGAVGGTAGAAVADRLLGSGRHAHVLTWSMALPTCFPALLLLGPTREVALIVMVVTSAAFAVFNVAALSMRHRLVPEVVLGRVLAAWRTAVLGAGALGALAGGALASARGLDAPFLLSAVIGGLAIVLWASVARGIPRFTATS